MYQKQQKKEILLCQLLKVLLIVEMQVDLQERCITQVVAM